MRSLLAIVVKSSALGLLILALLPVSFAGDLLRSEAPAPTAADQHVATALKFEVDGDAEFRKMMLDVALRENPEHTAARWHSGQVQMDGQWLPIEDAEAKWQADERLAEYRQMRTKYGTSAQADLILARWCDKQRLADQARYHWTRVYSSLPEFREEALRQLKLKPFHDGIQPLLATDEEIAEHREKVTQSIEAYQHYLPVCIEIKKHFQGDSARLREAALKRLAEMKDPLAIPAIETALSSAGEPLTSHVIYHLQKMPEHAATISLTRHAVFSPAESTRELAARALGQREVEDYAPWLLDQLVAPVKSQYWFERTPGGHLYYFHDFYREGANADALARQATLFRSDPIFIRRIMYGVRKQRTIGPVTVTQGRGKELSEEGLLEMQLTQHLRQLQLRTAIAEREADTARLNQQVTVRNERIVSVLEATTREKLGNEPVEWWNWWQRYNELYAPNTKPLRASYTQTGVTIPTVARNEIQYVPSCFAAATLVAVEDGLKPIESIQPGDRVLAQDAETGELAHKLVLGTTIRPPTDLLQLTVGDEEILTTKGHPFWIVGKGWRMAKFIDAGDRIHSTSGAVVVDAIEDLEPAPAYNLVVEDFHSYFVGKQRLLVHDNLLRKPTLAVVPGLKEEI